MDSIDPGGTTSTAKATILVVEDEVVVSLDIQHNLERLGYAVADSAITGREAIDLATDLRPDLVLIDIRLKGDMDGIEAADVIGKQLDIPVVFLTAYGDEQTMERVKSANPFGYLLKPVQGKDLHTAVEVALYRHRTDQALTAAHDELRVANEAMRLRAARAAAVGDLGLSALGGVSFEKLIPKALAEVTRLLSMDAAVLVRLDEEAGGLTIAAADPTGAIPEGTRVEGSVLNDALLSDTSTRLNDARIGHPISMTEGEAFCDGLAIRIDGYRGPWGLVVALCRQPCTLNEDDAQFLQLVANVLSMALTSTPVEAARPELSTPVLPLDRGLLLVPLIGTLDPVRMQHFGRVLLQQVRAHSARLVVLDVTGLAGVDAQSTNGLVQVVDAASLLGAKVLMSGISPDLSKALVALGMPLQRMRAVGDLQSAIEEGLRIIAR